MISHKPIPGMSDGVSEFAKFIPTLEQIESRPSPRVIKSHLPLYLLHPKLLDTSKVNNKMNAIIIIVNYLNNLSLFVY